MAKYTAGRGYDADGHIDLTEITEQDVERRKLEVLHDKLEKEYQKGFSAEKDPNRLIQLKNLRLTFLNIGPKVESLEFFENLETLFLQHNCIEQIGTTAFQFNINL